MRITNPEINIILFSNEDVIATSGITPLSGYFYIPTAQFQDPYTGSGEYVGFSGTYLPSGSRYVISSISGAVAQSSENERDGAMSGGSYYFPDLGVTVDMSSMEPIARRTYDAYYENGNYYTNGVSYYEQYWQ